MNKKGLMLLVLLAAVVVLGVVMNLQPESPEAVPEDTTIQSE
ncbi:hypothetical protein [Aquamicrobium zhengzhouense]|nr:hypothetical protein [Aquamicrobium zhengzhouense]